MWPLKSAVLAGQLGGRLVAGGAPPPDSINGLTTDSRAMATGKLFVPLKGDTFDGLDFVPKVLESAGCCALVSATWFEAAASGRSAPWPGACIVVDDVVAAFRRLAAAFRKGSGAGPAPRVLAVGGSNGKTTTKEMIVAMLGGRSATLVATEKSENGFVGIPKTLCGPEMTSAVQEIVLEVGIDEVGSMAQHLELVRPDIALLTSLSHEHLQGLGSLENVVREELVLMEGPWLRIWQLGDGLICGKGLELLRSGDWCVVPLGAEHRSNAGLLRQAAQRGCGLVTFRCEVLDDLSQIVGLTVSAPPGDVLPTRVEPVPVSLELTLPGRHNGANAALAFAAALAMRQKVTAGGVSSSAEGLAPALSRLCADLVAGFRSFVPPDLRSQLDRFADGSALLADCYNANPASVRASLDALHAQSYSSHSKLVFLGDMLDLGSESSRLHEELIFDLESMPNCQLYLYGEAMYPVFIKLKEHGFRGQLSHLPRERAPEQWLTDLPPRGCPVFALVKGSRGMAMERLLPGLRRYLEQT